MVSGGAQSDTIEAAPALPLVVQIRDEAGAPVAGAVVNLLGYPADSDQYAYRAMWVCRAPGDCNPYGLSLRTDSSGQLTVYGKLGTVAGNQWLHVSVPVVGIADSVQFIARPGNPVHFKFDIPDSSAYVGAGYSVGPHSADRNGNVTAPLTFTVAAIGTAATITSDGTFHASQIGRGMAEFRAGSIVDTAFISVPPQGQIATFDIGLRDKQGIVTMALDGTHVRRWTSIQDNDNGELPSWTPDGELLFQGNSTDVDHVMITDSNGVVRRATAPGSATFLELHAAAASDGTIYFAGRGPGDATYQLWEALGIGQTAIPAITTIDNTTDFDNPAPAPNGRDLAWESDSRGLYLMNRNNGASTLIVPIAGTGIVARNPRWSPDGTEILFNADTTLYLVHPDGTGVRPVGPKHLYYPRADFSPDGLWVIARTHNRLELINVATNASIVMPAWTETYLSPSWRH